jgi:putative endonuclease
MEAPEWFLYLLLSADGKRTYVGVTVDLQRRLEQHNGGCPGGARATRVGRPWRILESRGGYPGRAAAQRDEALVKQLPGRRRPEFFRTE